MSKFTVAVLAAALAWSAASGPVEAKRGKLPAPLDMATINDAAHPGRQGKGVNPLSLKAAVLLDRARFSPGVIDGRGSENLTKAIRAFQIAQGLPETGKLDAETWSKLATTSAEPAFVEYAVADADVKGPFLEKLPAKLEEMQGLKRLSYTSPKEALAERFHMSEALLDSLNKGRDLGQAGTKIVVANVGAEPSADREERAARLEIDKKARTLRAFAADGKLLSAYPASVGSAAKPAPSGTTEVRAVAENPTYTYNPDYAFKGVKADRKFDIAGGPNNPVGAVWIDLAIESYGIHGTPSPERIGKSYSHGCVRLTNWDAQELAGMVKKGTVVEFKD